LELAIDVVMGAPLAAVESPSHAVRVEMTGDRARVELGERSAALDRDFVLLLRSAAAPAPVVLVETDNRPSGTCGITALVAFRPEFDPGTAPSELWLVVDRSGSMQGSSMEEARNALQLCLRSLSPGHRFNIVGFGSSHELLFPSSRPYDQASLREASAYAAAIQADLGGTELLPALTAIVEQPLQAGHSRQLFVLTDGQISNTEEVIALAREHSVDTRIFTFGIGAGASRHLVSGLARAGEGQAEFIAPGERMEGKVLRQLRRALAPALTGVEVDWGTRKVTQAPLRVPAVFDGGRVLVYGLLEPTDAPFEVVLRAHYGDKRLEWRVTVDPSRAVPGTQLRTLAARGLIRDLEEGMSPLHDRRGSLQERGREDRVRQAIIRLGTTYGLTSRHTSLVAVEHRDQPESAEAQLRRVPILLTRGWGGFDAAPGAPSPAAASDVSLMLRAPSPAALAAPFTAGRPRLAELADEVGTRRSSGGLNWPFRARAGKDARRKEPGAAPKSEAARRPLDALIELQEFDGSWDLTAELARVMGQSLRAWQDALGRQGRDPLVRRAVGTGLALRWLEENAATERGEWELLAEKAVRWLEQCPVRPLGGGDWIESARRLVTA
jgi:Ca-activated chloride channel family protein